MQNVRRPMFVILNNRFLPNDLGSSVELDKMPQIGKMARLHFCGITAVDDEKMLNAQCRFDGEEMGSPKFCGIRFDANENHPIENVTLTDITYIAVGGEKTAPSKTEYPKVIDRLLDEASTPSENYWPDWSLATNAHLRNIKDLSIQGLSFQTLLPDARPKVIIESCTRRATGVKP